MTGTSEMPDLDPEEQALEQEYEKLQGLSVPRHQLEVTLGKGNDWGLSLNLTCPGGEDARCHWWRDDEENPGTLAAHPDCSIVEWFHIERTSFVEDGYAGEEHDGLTSGPIEVTTWGEDGFEWNYAEEAH